MLKPAERATPLESDLQTADQTGIRARGSEIGHVTVGGARPERPDREPPLPVVSLIIDWLIRPLILERGLRPGLPGDQIQPARTGILTGIKQAGKLIQVDGELKQFARPDSSTGLHERVGQQLVAVPVARA
jgi:hypothetical protein